MTLSNCAKCTPENTVTILQTKVGYLTQGSKFAVLSSWGAGPCLIMAVYNPETKKAALTHIDASTSMYSVEMIFNNIKGESVSPSLNVYLSGSESAPETVKQVMEVVNQQPNVIVESFVGESSSLAIDLDGKVYSVEPFQTCYDSTALALVSVEVLNRAYNNCHNGICSAPHKEPLQVVNIEIVKCSDKSAHASSSFYDSDLGISLFSNHKTISPEKSVVDASEQYDLSSSKNHLTTKDRCLLADTLEEELAILKEDNCCIAPKEEYGIRYSCDSMAFNLYTDWSSSIPGCSQDTANKDLV